MFRLRDIGRVRKKTVLAAIVAIAVVLATVAGVLLLSSRILNAQTPFFRVTDTSLNGGNVIGTGLDLDWIQSSNLLQDPSFEPMVFHGRFTALGGGADRLTVAAEEAMTDLYGEGFFDGASVRVMSLSGQDMILRKNATVASYGVNRLGGFQDVHLPSDLPKALPFFAFAQSDETIVAVGGRGTVLVGIDTHTPVAVKTGIDADLTGICATDDRTYIAVSRDGHVLASQDAVTWTEWNVPADKSLHAIASSGVWQVAAGPGGTVLAGANGTMTSVSVPIEADWTDIVYGAGSFLACGNDGALMRSSNGIVWLPLERVDRPDWACADYRDGLFAVAGAGARLCLVPVEGPTTHLVVPGAGDIVDVLFLSRRQLVVLDADGRFFVSDDGGILWVESDLETGRDPRRMAATVQDRVLIAGADGSLGISQMVNEIVLDTPLVEGTFQPGDLVFLEYVAQQPPASFLLVGAEQVSEPWSSSLPGAMTRVDTDAAPGSGSGCVALSLTPAQEASGQASFLSQVLVGEDEKTRFEKAKLYTAEFWLRQEGVASREVLVWLSGRFETVGTVIENVGNTWKKYETTFVLPETATAEQPGEVRFQIGFRDAGTLWVDAAWFGPADEGAGMPDTSFATQVQAAHPSVLRFPFLGIGEIGTRSGAWAHSLGNESSALVDGQRRSVSCGSLDTALRLAMDTGAQPWLRVGPFASDAEIRNLVEYLAGPITEPYGKRRMENGSGQPWTDVFNRIYLEVGDTEGIMGGDSRKASFVNHVIGLVQQSPYYSAIRNQITFVDGMEYETALMLSTADYHASALEAVVNGGDAVSELRAAYRAFFDRSPRMPDRPSDVNYEMVSRFSLRVTGNAEPTLSTWMEAVALGAREGYSVQLFHVAQSDDLQEMPPAQSAARALSARCLQGSALTVEPLEGAPTTMTAYAYRNGLHVHILLINHAKQAYTFPVASDLRLEGALVQVYDENGQPVSEETMRRSGSAVDVLPGGVTVLEIREGEMGQ